MSTSLLKSKFAATAMIQAAAVVTLALTTVSPAFAQGRKLTGTWFVVTQQRHCATDAPIGPSHRALVTFHAGGTLSDTSVVPAFLAGQRSEGHGIWAHDGGLTYIARWTAMINFTTPPARRQAHLVSRRAGRSPPTTSRCPGLTSSARMARASSTTSPARSTPRAARREPQRA